MTKSLEKERKSGLHQTCQEQSNIYKTLKGEKYELRIIYTAKYNSSDKDIGKYFKT